MWYSNGMVGVAQAVRPGYQYRINGKSNEKEEKKVVWPKNIVFRHGLYFHGAGNA